MDVPVASRHEMGWIQREKLFVGRIDRIWSLTCSQTTLMEYSSCDG
jgi:hypothetical protein